MPTDKISRRSMLTASAVLAISPLIPHGEAAAAPGTPTKTLTAVEVHDLLFMREEEKLARDVYLTLFEEWNTTIFANIATSEQRHMDAILGLLNTYRLSDPAAGKQIGQFDDRELQDLYRVLIRRGKRSSLSALKVGGFIEETDIEDLQAAMANARLSNIDNVYANLLNGSYSHLRAFARSITAKTGRPYVAQVLPQKTVNAILGV
jgi:hypothetical protein